MDFWEAVDLNSFSERIHGLPLERSINYHSDFFSVSSTKKQAAWCLSEID